MKAHACSLQWCTTNVIGFLHAQAMHSSSIFFMFFIAFRCWFHSCFTFGYLTTLGAIWSIIICKSVRTAAILTLENSIPSSPPATQARPQGSHGIVMWVEEFKSENSKELIVICLGREYTRPSNFDMQISKNGSNSDIRKFHPILPARHTCPAAGQPWDCDVGCGF